MSSLYSMIMTLNDYCKFHISLLILFDCLKISGSLLLCSPFSTSFSLPLVPSLFFHSDHLCSCYLTLEYDAILLPFLLTNKHFPFQCLFFKHMIAHLRDMLSKCLPVILFAFRMVLFKSLIEKFY